MENKQFFDPYNFNNMVMQPATQVPAMQEDINFSPIASASPTMFYEQQFWYYNYLTKMMEYKIKVKEYEKLTNNNNKQP